MSFVFAFVQRDSRSLPLTLLVVVIVLAVTACPASRQPAKKHTSLGGAVQLPEDWPIAELSLPEGVARDELPFTWRCLEGATESEWVGHSVSGNQCWIVSFDGDLTWDDLVAYTESILLPVGYKLVDWEDTKRTIPNLQWTLYKEYMAPDRKTEVRVGYDVAGKNVLHEAYECYYYEITISNTPVGKRRNED